MNPSMLCDDLPAADDPMDDWLFLSHKSVEFLSDTTSLQETGDKGKLKSKLVSVWNSVKYGWSLKQKTKFSKSSPLILLGKSYELKDEANKERFRRSFASLLWLTYRRGFPQLAGSSLTTDSGWGCVLRTGQMLLARGLLTHLMPPGWMWSVWYRAVKDDLDLPHHADCTDCKSNMRCRYQSLGSLYDRPLEAMHRKVVSWFADHPKAPFGIHRLVELGASSGKKAGDWYGPSIVAHILQKAVAASVDLPNLVVYVAQDCTIYLQDVRGLCERPPPHSWKSVIILVPVRLGGQDLNPSYISCVKKLLELQCCIGIIGGRPKHSLFFVGFQDDQLLYLDPHYCQLTVNVTKENFPLESFHCKYPRKMPFSRMDPSCTIGFYASGQQELELLCTNVNEVVSTSAEGYPMFIFSEGESWKDEEHSSSPVHRVTYIQRSSDLKRVSTSSSMDEFVLL
ncbi:cysteine protease ATG4D isoform X1 [Oryzias latipes]|uniref:Cysteine protease n=2 Tax=Oryzias latipes TaxID=8090 RepID=A0A3P9K5Y1_ORYLA|nr:cysteine protease ATG4D isoform X1 [Oryzias latipes]XP_011476874.1 cysteine protease ATG4D isoform X1 [Oryzias latipes]